MVINAADVKRWTQPTPLTTEGHAAVEFDCFSTSSAAVVGVARLVPDCHGPVAVPLAGSDAVVRVEGVVLLMPRQIASATVEFDCEAPANRPPVNLGLAQARIAAPATAVAEIEALSTPVLFSFNDFEPTSEAVAQVSMFDYGWGSPPVFPFKFPTRFTDNLLNIQDAAADIRLDCESFDGGAGADCVALLDIRTSNQFMLQGNLPVFPWWFPVVFDDDADVNVALARILGMYSAATSAVACVAAAMLPTITAEGQILGQTMFPFRFPAVFWAPWQDGPAEFTLDATGPAVVEIYAPTLAALESDCAAVVEQAGQADVEITGSATGRAAVEGEAAIEATGDGVDEVAGSCSATVEFDNTGSPAVEAVGLASIAMFTPDDLVDVIEAVATIIAISTADGIEVHGTAPALAAITAICAATIPQIGSATAAFDISVANVVAAQGVASMLITSTATTVDVVVFPFRFPAMFIPPYGSEAVFPLNLPILFS